MRRAAAGAVLLLAAGIAAPFVFATPLTRWLIARSTFADVPLTFGSASLSPAGALTLYDVRLADRTVAGRDLATASKVRIEFGISDLRRGRARLIAVENLDLTLRPGQKAALSLLEVFQAARPAVTPSTTPATTNAGRSFALAIPFDQLLLLGHVRAEGFEPWLAFAQIRGGDRIPIQAAMTNSSANADAYSISVTAGEANSARPGLKARLALRSREVGVTLSAEQISIQNLPVMLSASALSRLEALPDDFAMSLTGRADQITLSGSATLSADTTINLLAEVRNLNERLIAADGQTPAALAENFSASTRVTGKLTNTPLRDLTFTNTRCSWDNLQMGDLRLLRGMADWQVVGTEIMMTDLQATMFDTPLWVSGAWDTSTKVLSRGRLRISNFSAPRMLSRLPAAIRERFPANLEGELSVRASLKESDAEHIAAHVEIAADETLRFLVPPPAPQPATAPAAQAGTPLATISNGLLSGTVSWNYRLDTLPEVSHGRFVADDIFLHGAAQEEGAELSLVKSDFTFGSGILRIIDCYANLAGDGSLAASATYAVASGSFEQASLRIENGEATMLQPWLPSLSSGLFSLSLEGKGSAAFAEATATVALPPDSPVQIAEDADTVLSLAGPRGGSTAISLGLRYDGKSDRVSGSVTLESMTARRIQGEQEFSLAGIESQGSFAFPLKTFGPQTVELSALSFEASEMRSGANAFTDLSLKGSLREGRASIQELTTLYAGGSVSAEAVLSLAAGLEKLSLQFNAIEQATLTQHLYPEVFTAQGPISGTLELSRASAQAPYQGSIRIMSDDPGRLRISRETSKTTFAPVARAAAQANQATVLPDNFDDIVTSQMSDFPYLTGRARLEDDNGKLRITLFYDRLPLKPGDPGYGVPVTIDGKVVSGSIKVDLQGPSLTVQNSVAEILLLASGFKNQLFRTNRPAPPPSTSP